VVIFRWNRPDAAPLCLVSSKKKRDNKAASSQVSMGSCGETMMRANGEDITKILRAAGAGDGSAIDRLMPLVYDELRALAESYLQRERADHTLQATALVHEVYVRLVRQEEVEWQNRAHFFAVAAQAIRRILVDHARGHQRLKRGGDRQRVRLEEDAAFARERDLDLLALDEAMDRLAKLSERQARVVELRFFGGIGLKEIAEVLGVSPRTVDGDWSMARAWLRRELSKGTGT
jgi:RNA polymerase sigma factor (TIGR02999 family)